MDKNNTKEKNFKRPLVEAEDTSSSNIDRELPEPKRQKRSRTIFTCLQLHNLEGMFEVNEYPDKLMRESIAAELDVTENKINNWFQNRRAKLRKQLGGRHPSLSPSLTTTISTTAATSKPSPQTPLHFLSSWSPLHYPQYSSPTLITSMGTSLATVPTTPIHYQLFAPQTTIHNALPIMDLTPPPSVTVASPQY